MRCPIPPAATPSKANQFASLEPAMAYFFRKTGKAAHGCLPHFASAVPQMRHMSLTEQAPQNQLNPSSACS